jgi:hypothetical protein
MKKMKKIIFTLIATLGFGAFSKAQLFKFANQIGNSGYEQGYGVTADINGNSYVSGAFSGNVDFDPSGSVLNLTSNGLSDVYIAKYNQEGAIVWAKSFGSSAGDDYSYNIQVSSSGEVYAVGFFTGTVDFDPGAGVFNLSSSGAEDGFIIKLDNSGNFLWAIKIGGSQGDGVSTITIDNQNNVIVSGQFRTTADFDPSTNVQNLVSNGGTDCFFAKYDSNGLLIWVKQIGNSTADERIESSLDANNNIYTSGYFQGTIDLDPNTGISNAISVGGEDIYIAKYSNNGNLIWSKLIGGSQLQRPIRTLNDNNDYFYVTGIFDGTCDFDPSSNINSLTSDGVHDAFIAKYDTSGNYIWAVGYGGSGDDNGYGIAVDGTGNVYGIGNYSGTVDFDPSANVFSSTSNGLHDICLTKHSSSGQFLWAKSIGGTGDDLGWNTALKNGTLHYTGHFKNTADFEPNQPILNLTSLGDFDAFLLSMGTGECISTIYDTVTTNITVYDTTLISVTDTLLINVTITSINPPNNINTFKVYPNPANDHITIDNGNIANLTGYQVKITNSLSQQVFQSAITQQQFYVDLSTWTGNGIYFVHIIDGQGNTIDIKKIVLQ